MKHSDVNRKNAEVLLKTAYNNLKVMAPAKLRVGDVVRISKYTHIFLKRLHIKLEYRNLYSNKYTKHKSYHIFARQL